MTDVTIRLTKQRGDSLGIGFRKLAKPPHCEVSILVENGVAARSGLIHQGDLLLGVNGINVQHLSPSEVGGVLARHSVDSNIALEVRRQVMNGSMNEINKTMDVEPTPNINDSLDMNMNPRTNGHPTIIVEPNSPPVEPNLPPVSPDCVSPVVDGPPEASLPVVGRPRGGNQMGAGKRIRRPNVLAGGALPEIQESVEKNSLSLDVQVPVTHRHSLTPEVKKPVDEVKRMHLRSSKSLDLANLPQWRASGSAQSVTLHNVLDGSEMSDRLHNNGIKVLYFHPWYNCPGMRFLQVCLCGNW